MPASPAVWPAAPSQSAVALDLRQNQMMSRRSHHGIQLVKWEGNVCDRRRAYGSASPNPTPPPPIPGDESIAHNARASAAAAASKGGGCWLLLSSVGGVQFLEVMALSTYCVSDLPLKEIPGDYGLPLIGAIKDRVDFNWLQGQRKFYESRRDKYKSTVFRTNVPPGPPGYPNSRVVVLLDQKSFPALFDLSKVEKKDIFTGTYFPSWEFTGGFRTLPFLDPSEDKHAKLKAFTFDILKSSSSRVLPSFHDSFTNGFAAWEAAIQKDGKAGLGLGIDAPAFEFLVRSWLGHELSDGGGDLSLGANGYTLGAAWVAVMLAPIADLGLPKLVQELTIHSFPMPFSLVKKQYTKLYNYFDVYGAELLELAVNAHGLDRTEALHNLILFIAFNSWGGLHFMFPSIVQYVGRAGAELHKELADEVRGAVRANGGLSVKCLSQMPLVESTCYEVLRISPPVSHQYGRAKVDFVIESHDAAFQIRKGEILAGYQPMATQDPMVFTDPTSFQPKRFLGARGQNLLKYLLWSNGPQTESPTLDNKQCSGKDYITMLGQLYICELFLKYDSLELSAPDAKGSTFLTSLKPATS